jgi:UDP-N-acetylglucosamine--N-acetylmuramyl-(pentapeptide) pyrophosphoryl-undecaprenol N-acetylglucosamine transferase
MKIVMTGGHHSSALPVIEKLKERYPEVQILWLGHRHSLKGDKNDTLEYQEIVSKGIPFHELHAGKVYRIRDVIRLLKVPLGFIEALYFLIKHRPDVIMSFGGYLAVPVVVCGKLLGIPSITHEQTVVTGYANRVISWFSDKILISWPTSEKYFAKDKVIFSGIPLRKSIFTPSSNVFNFDNELPVIYITAGKSGSHTINLLIKESLAELLKFSNVIHQCGDNSVFNDSKVLEDAYREILAQESLPGCYVVKKFIFENEIGEAYARSTLVLARSGAHTVSELAALNKPALLIPLPNTSHNEQERNAEYLSKSGLALVLPEVEATPDKLVASLRHMLSHISDYKLSGGFERGDTEPSEVIVDELIKTALKKE